MITRERSAVVIMRPWNVVPYTLARRTDSLVLLVIAWSITFLFVLEIYAAHDM